MVLLRGFDQLPELPRFPEVYGLRAAAIAAYPMYRGLAKLVGMDVLKTGGTFADEIATLREHWQAYDFFFVHYKDTDKAGEDGDFDAKVQALERFDAFIPSIRDAAGPTCSSSPAITRRRRCSPPTAGSRCPRWCGAATAAPIPSPPSPSGHAPPARSGLIPAQHLMPIVMANALRLTKFGA